MDSKERRDVMSSQPEHERGEDPKCRRCGKTKRFFMKVKCICCDRFGLICLACVHELAMIAKSSRGDSYLQDLTTETKGNETMSHIPKNILERTKQNILMRRDITAEVIAEAIELLEYLEFNNEHLVFFKENYKANYKTHNVISTACAKAVQDNFKAGRAVKEREQLRLDLLDLIAQLTSSDDPFLNEWETFSRSRKWEILYNTVSCYYSQLWSRWPESEAEQELLKEALFGLPDFEEMVAIAKAEIISRNVNLMLHGAIPKHLDEIVSTHAKYAAKLRIGMREALSSFAADVKE